MKYCKILSRTLLIVSELNNVPNDLSYEEDESVT